VINLPVENTRELAKLAQRTMQLQCTIQDGQVWLSDGNQSVMIERITLKSVTEK